MNMKKLLIIIPVLLAGLLIPLRASASTPSWVANLKCIPPPTAYWVSYCAIYGPNGSYTQRYTFPTGSYWVGVCSQYPDYCAHHHG